MATILFNSFSIQPDGVIPYLTPHLLQKCFPVEQVQDHLLLGIAVRDACVAAIFSHRKHPVGFSFTDTTIDPWLQNYKRVTCPTFDLEQDATQYSPKKVADETTLSSGNPHVMVWTDNGRLKLTNEGYLQAAQELNSQVKISLFDSCTLRARDKRRLQATERTMQWKKELVQKRTTNETWASCLLVHSKREFPAEQEQYTALQKAVEDQTIQGIVFVGPSTTSPHLESAVEKLQCNTTTLAVLSVHSLPHFLQCYQAGIHVLGVNLPAQWAKTGKAFVADFRHYNHKSSKRSKVEEEDGDVMALALDSDGCYTVDKTWIRDARPICPGCNCMACQEHSRAYLYHLVLTKELLVGIMLFIHNLHHMLDLCRELTKARQEGNQKEIVEYIEKQLAKME